MVIYAQSTITVISGNKTEKKERKKESERERENSNSKTLFYKDCRERENKEKVNVFNFNLTCVSALLVHHCRKLGVQTSVDSDILCHQPYLVSYSTRLGELGCPALPF